MPLPLIHPSAGMVIDHSVRVEPGVYALSSSDLKRPAITIRGHDVTVDLKGVVLRGSPSWTAPDARPGLSILVDGGVNVTIENAEIHGYKLAVLARNTVGLHLTHCDWSYNWKQRLKSTPEREDEADWMFFQKNDRDEWIDGNPDTGVAYGCGGAYLSNCQRFRVDHCLNTGSQCGLMMSRCSHGTVIDNDFSFLSAIGIGLYRSSDNFIVRNSLDYCVRGYSHYVYSRGEDSAAILVYEQSNRNAFVANSGTEGGDGFFLWAGQSTLDTGKGGCNDNVVVGNDFSHSPANGIEATFSRNTFLGNRLVECWHGVWGGFSFDSSWIGNTFQFDEQAFAIEHGQHDSIIGNAIQSCDEGAVLWAVPNRVADINYLKLRDTASRDPVIQGNSFTDCATEAVSLTETTNGKVVNNRFKDCAAKLVVKAGGKVVLGLDHVEPRRPAYFTLGGDNVRAVGSLEGRFEGIWKYPPAKGQIMDHPFDFSGGRSVTRPPDHLFSSLAFDRLRGPNEWGREHILVDQWGPYDYRYPKLWPVAEGAGVGDVETLKVLGPPGRWRVRSTFGARVVGPTYGSVPGTLKFKVASDTIEPVSIQCLFRGATAVSPYGERVAAGHVYVFDWAKFYAPIHWAVRWYRWGADSDPRQPDGWEKMLETPSIAHDEPVGPLNYAGGSMFKGLPPDHYGTVADGTFSSPAGDYLLKLTTDDGARAWVDGKPVITTTWHYQGPTGYQATLHLSRGRHRIHVDHFQIDGYATLQVELANP